MSAKKRNSDRKRSRPITKRSKLGVLKKNKLGIGISLIVIISVVIAGIYFVYIGNNSNQIDNGKDNEDQNPIAIINTSMGTISVELYLDKAPITCNNFIKLANDGFYDGLIFHRIKDDFMIQGGGYTPDWVKKQSPYDPIPLETHPDLTHEDGAISMARLADPNINSATTEFFICDGDQSYRLDDAELQKYGVRGYAVFGKTIEGIEVLREIASLELDPDKIGEDGSGPPLNDVIINSIIIEHR